MITATLTLVIMGSCSAIRRSATSGHDKNSSSSVASEKKRDKNIEKEIIGGLHGDVKAVVEEALSWVGTPYLYGGNDKNGADCSGFVMVVFDTSIGYKLPRTSTKQGDFCKKINQGDVRAGDLVFFATGKDPERISHVGLMIDNTRFLHASSTKGVCLSTMESNYYRKHFIKFGRVPHFEKTK